MEQVKELRSRTGAGILDAKQALEEASGDVEKAILALREKGKITAAKKAGRTTGEGVIGSYIHTNGKIGVLVCLLCETDFVAHNGKFQELARNLAIHIAAADPVVVHPEDVSEEEIAIEREMAQKHAVKDKKPAEIQEKIIEGKLKKYREERALLTQPYLKDPSKSVADLIEEAVLELKENITVGSFTRLVI